MSQRRLAALIASVSAVAFVAALFGMTLRIRDFNTAAHRVRWHADPIQTREFHLEGFPRATLTDGPDVGPEASRSASVVLDYGGVKTSIPVKRPPVKDMPNLALYDEWLAVLAVNEVGLDQPEPGPAAHSIVKPGTGKLLIVVRKTPEGYDPESWGSVRRIEWVFDYYELRPDGQVTRYERRWPRSDRAEKRLQGLAVADINTPPAGLSAEDASAWSDDVARSKTLAAIPALDQRSAEYFAALHVIPKLNVPKYKFNDTAFDIKTMGWTLPTAMVALLAFTIALVFAIAPRIAAKPVPARA